MTRRPHLSDGALQALRDREGPIGARLRARLHLWLCERCAARAHTERVDADRTGALLALDVLRPDIEDAWHRFVIRSAYRTSQGGSWWRSHPRLAAPSVIAATAAAAAIVCGAVLYRSAEAELVTRMYRLSAQDRTTPKAPSVRDREFARSLATLEARGGLRRVSDVCCADRDGEGPADDGVLTVSLAGSLSPVVILYEDTQRQGRFLPGDVILIVSRPGLSAAAPASPGHPL